MLGLISQKDSENSAAIALSTMRDSTAMKTIAILTTIFLHGTYVATLVATMINWSPSGNGSSSTVAMAENMPAVSPYIWIYWVISIPLTLVVMVLWWFLSKREYYKSQMRMAI